jgi:hypothetical protein
MNYNVDHDIGINDFAIIETSSSLKLILHEICTSFTIENLNYITI